MKNLTCIICPRGCGLTVEETADGLKVLGNLCPRGEKYAIEECTHPVRTVTSTMACENGAVVAVKTDKPIPRELVFDCMKAINGAKAPTDTKIGDVLIANVLGTDANVVATQNA